VEQKYRQLLDEAIETLARKLCDIDEPHRSACITYIFSKLLRTFFSSGNWLNRSEPYRIIASAKREHERTCLDDYEQSKRIENGDVL